MGLLVARNGPRTALNSCPFSGAKRKPAEPRATSGFDPIATLDEIYKKNTGRYRGFHFHAAVYFYYFFCSTRVVAVGPTAVICKITSPSFAHQKCGLLAGSE
jgi:hypothetical protein